MSLHVLSVNFNDFSKVATFSIFLWRNATCSCCGNWAKEEFLSAGCFRLSVAVFVRRKWDRTLQESAAGVSKEKGKRDPSVSGEKRRAVSISLVLKEKTALEYKNDARPSAHWFM